MANNSFVTKQFHDAIAMLNERQRTAVQAIDGPVMVVAGPGTGKTQLLAARIGTILLRPDVKPEEILCLTFTDAAMINMQERLRDYVGSMAYRIPVYTFHAFCNEVIMTHREEFSQVQELSAITDLEHYDLVKELLESLATDHPLYSVKGASPYEIRQFIWYFSKIKDENYDAASLQAELIEELKERKEKGEFDYQRKFKEFQKGDLNPKKYEEALKRVNKSISALSLYDNYVAAMDAAGYYTFKDMILWVVGKFEQDEEFLAQYQERFQYVLIDEYQDTNGSQNRLAELLTSYWDRPNLFVVGDDDQSIYRFQGASTGNIIAFREKYNPEIIILEENYRSVQTILDASMALIATNDDRLVSQDPEFTKDLKASHPAMQDVKVEPLLMTFDTPTAESSHLYERLKERFSSGEDLSDTAVIYKKHSQSELLIDALSKSGIPFQVGKKENLLSTILFRQLRDVLSYLTLEADQAGAGDHEIFSLLHFDFFGIPAYDIARLSLHLSQINSSNRDSAKRTRWRDLLQDDNILRDAGIDQTEVLLEIGAKLEILIGDVANHTSQVFLDRVIHQLGIMEYILQHPQRIYLLQILRVLYTKLKDETERMPTLSIVEFLAILERYGDYDIDIPVSLHVGAKQGVHLITAHGSKGLEYERVYVIGCVESRWAKDGGRAGAFLFPGGGTSDEEKAAALKERRRVLYVAMTRAKKELYLCRYEMKDNGRPEKALPFLTEIEERYNLQEQVMEASADDLGIFIKSTELDTSDPPIISGDIIDAAMSRMAMSVTGLSKYLRCHMEFYFENILRVPSGRNQHMGFGNVVHRSLEHLYEAVDGGASLTSDLTIQYFKSSMDYYASHFTREEYERYMDWGKTEFVAFVKLVQEDDASADDIKLEYTIKNTDIEGVPVSGAIDKILVYGRDVKVVDYKTGNPDKSSMAANLKPHTARMTTGTGGDYWRQMVFYKLLLQADPRSTWTMTDGYFHFVQRSGETGEFVKKHVDVDLEAMSKVKEQLRTSYLGIKNHEFHKRCDTCRWCKFLEYKNLDLQYVEDPEPDR